jgi:predicted dienelactone hydrolase
VFFLACCSVALADSGVGLGQITFVDASRNRTLDTHVWYPTIAAATGKYGGNIAFEGFAAAENGAISARDAPLYLLAHGTSGNWRNLSWLAARLAASGAIVVATDHPGQTSGDATPASVIRVWHQPDDLKFLLDAVLHSQFGPHIDRNKIAVIGYSLGGYSALAAAGAIVDIAKYVQFCAVNDDAACTYFRPAFATLGPEYFAAASQDHTIAGISATVAIAPGLVESMTPASMRNIAVPILIVGAEFDRNVPPSTHLRPFLENFPRSTEYTEIPGAKHFSFMQICLPGAAKLLAEEDAAFVCEDGDGADRTRIHDEVFGIVSEFLNEKLGIGQPGGPEPVRTR